MSLATRCTHCDTIFRVVQDQLKVSEGWVRCGRCQQVFNALDTLFDLDAEAAPSDPPAGEAPLPADAAPATTPPHQQGPQEDTRDADEPVFAPAEADPVPPAEAPVAPIAPMMTVAEATPEGPFDDDVPSPRPVPLDATPAARVAERDRIDFADAQFNSALLAEEGIAVDADLAELAVAPADEPAGADASTPEFLRQAERRARWGRPRTVALMALLCGVLGLVLVLQAALHYRDLLAAVAPQTEPALARLCEWAGCRIEPLRRIDAIVVDSSTLTAVPGGDAVRLAVVLRNRGPLTLAMPSIELSLTDPAGQMLARRVLSPADFGVRDATLPAASESTLQLALSTNGRRASGYTVEPFYP